jgi:hypothetical protein
MEVELKELQDAITAVGPAIENVKAKRAALHAAIDAAVDKVGKQVAADTSIQPPAQTTSGQ